MSSAEDLASFQAWALEVLRLAAAPAELQRAEIDRLRVGVDEIALQLDDLAYVAEAHQGAGSIGFAEGQLIRSVDELINRLCAASSHMLTSNGLDEPEWESVRRLASEVITELSSSWSELALG
ncbi:MAG: hypothetical protein HOV79_10885 [Hamadaea sp.]|nr:hypothetical protein [Hamadaea sp.]